MERLQHICDFLEQGLIVIDRDGIIKVYNHTAKDFFGLLPSPGPGHPSGRLEQDDIVIIANNRVGRDDGNMDKQHLQQLGLGQVKLKKDMGILAVGQVKTGKARTAVRTFTNESEPVIMDFPLRGNCKISAGYDRNQRLLWIDVEGQRFPYNYHIAVGHMVILSSDLQVKFYQAPGYTARGEAIGDILNGAPWTAKGNQDLPQVIGRHISDIHPRNLGIERLLTVAGGQENGFVKQDYEINGIPTRCSIHPIDTNGIRQGAMLQVTDISEMRIAEEERDQAVASLRRLKENQAHPAFARITGSSTEINRIRELASRASTSNSTVLLLGESGTGKGLLAEVIHQTGPRAEGPFVYVNCAAIPGTLLESELFGYAPGAFTGASLQGKAGSFEQAQSGTLFLDEIGELDVTLQAKILHALQNRRIQRLGENHPIDLDVRIIAATNRNLEKAVAEGKFREDLFYRLNVISLELPPLRQRPGDIPDLVNVLLPRICQRAGKSLLMPHPQLIRTLTNYHWPGNIRELENVLERCVNFAEGKVLLPEHLPPDLHQPQTKAAVSVNQVIPHQQAIELTEQSLLALALKHTENNRTRAMSMLQMGRTNFYHKLKKYNLLR
ncbi:MAG: AAA family ATPase [Firmicutes bacterium]|nr:AAA family ATPase [Bacillota bacterium]